MKFTIRSKIMIRHTINIKNLVAVSTLVLLVPFNIHPQRNQKAQRSVLTPEGIFSKIKETAVTLVRADSSTIKKPIFEYNEKLKLLEYYLGNIKGDRLGIGSDDPYLLPFEKQIHIETLRNLFYRVAPNESFWKSILILSEQLVLDTVRDIENTHNKDDLRKKLDIRTELFDLQFSFLHQSIRIFAQQKGYTASRIGDRGLASDFFTVQIIKNPQGGRVQVLPWVKYVLCQDLGRCGNKWPWRELVSQSESMVGEYYYQAEWPGGRRNEGKIDVRNNSPLTFSPRE